MKSMTYPEYVVIAKAARALGRPVAWVSTRAEGMLTDNAGRDLIARAELGFDADHRITAYRVDLVTNLGAYNSQFGQAIQTELFVKVLTGVYKVPCLAPGRPPASIPAARPSTPTARWPARGDPDDRAGDGSRRTGPWARPGCPAREERDPRLPRHHAGG